jgi:hypothetical protein
MLSSFSLAIRATAELHKQLPPNQPPSPCHTMPKAYKTRSTNHRNRDAFSKREKASEDLYVRQKEREKLKELKAKIEQQQKHLKELGDHMYVSSFHALHYT